MLRADQRLVTKIPLAELWDESGTIAGERIRNLDENTVLELVRSGSMQFVVADIGLKLNWIPTEKRFEFWKSVRPQIADPTKPIYLGQFPNGAAYIASEWRGRVGNCFNSVGETSLSVGRRGPVRTLPASGLTARLDKQSSSTRTPFGILV